METVEKKLTKKEKMINAIMQKENAKRENYKGYIIITHDPLCIAHYRSNSRRVKPSAHWRYRTQEEFNEALADLKNSADIAFKRDQEYLEKCTDEAKKFQEGVILVSLWGYEQTNVDFYKILKRTKSSVIIQRIGGKIVDQNNDMDYYVVADPSNVIGEPMLKRISKHATISLNSYANATVWDGTRVNQTSYY